MDKSREILSQIITYMKYARYLPDKKRRETWKEIVDRNKAMHIKKFPHLKKEIEEAYKLVYEKKLLPSGRSLQFAGKPIELNNSRMFNCSYLPIDSPKAFSEVMFLLLAGCGVGYSIQYHHIKKLPEIRKPKKTRRFLIGDSIIGWADAVKVLIQAYMGDRKALPIFDYSDIRPKGTPLKTSGGLAPGPEPLKRCLTEIQLILDRKQDGEKLTPLECHEILCHIGDCVLAGGIRRSAMISLFSFDDNEMKTCKVHNWFEQKPHLARANNSAVLVRHKIIEEESKDFIRFITKTQTGEPGFLLTNDEDEYGTNPCLRGDTKIFTDKGIYSIHELVGKEFSVVDMYGKVCKAKAVHSGVKKLYRLKLTYGHVDCTEDHLWPVYKSTKVIFKKTIELLKEDAIPIVSAPFYFSTQLDPDEYEKGRTVGQYYSTAIEPNLADVFPNSESFLRGFLSGLAEKMMTVVENGVKFHSSKKSFLEDLRILFGFFGVQGSIVKVGDKENYVYGVYHKRFLRRLVHLVGLHLFAKYSQLISSMSYKEDKPLFNYVHEVIPLDIEEDVYDLKVKSITHTFQLPYCVTHNCGEIALKSFEYCNLVEINSEAIKTQEEFNHVAKMAARLATLQASYTDFHYLRPEWQEVCEKEYLIGVSLTGIAAGNILKLDLKEAAENVKKENETFAEKLGIKPAYRTCTVKPSGTASLIFGTSSGIHPYFAKYYFRRIRVSKIEPIYKYLARNHPELLEDDYFKPETDAIIRIPIKAPEDAITRNESVIHFLNRVKKVYKEWILTGHRKGSNTNNVSATAIFKEKEIDKMVDWLWENKDYYAAITLLPYDDTTYIQPPFEEIDEQTFKKYYKTLKSIDLSKIKEEEDNTKLSQEIACSGGQCEIT